ncbi:MAG TPA: 6-phosphogluconolactonase [Elusimicrobia bacterium]|nr:6-phosphogluconolactonase [Elusimicrobiota bacterium]
MKNRSARKFKTGEAMAGFAAGLFEKALTKKNGKFTVALSGGRTPALLFKKLAAMPLPWDRVIFFLADERLVPVSSRDSNFGTARRALFSKIKIPPANLRPVKTAASYERELLSETAPSNRLDFVFLGLGADGHTASIFPGSAAEKSEKLALAITAPRGVRPEHRLTLTPKALERARTVVMMAAGPAKKKVFELAVRGDKKIPAGRLAPRGEFHLLFAEKE